METGVRLWKMTKKGRFGFRVICDPLIGLPSDEFPLRFATPHEYLVRLLLHNELVEGMNRLEGFLRTDQGISIVTSQRFVQGRNATEIEVSRYFQGHGSRRICTGAWYQAERNLAVFDVAGHNFVSTNGVLVPVDVIPARPSESFRERILAIVEGWV
jgi:Serine/Threonine/Tyrosine Kinase found in polyvalent proteins